MGTLRVPEWARRNANQMLAVGVGVLVIGASAWVALKARGVAAEVASRRAAWEQAASQLATVRQQFRPPTSTESAALISEASRMGTLGVPASEKLALVDMVGNLAEACALRAVRVNAVAASDSAFLPERQVAGTRIEPADYALAVEFVGSFADAQKFVSSLPPSVSLYRLTAARSGAGAVYHVLLSVYQLNANSGT